MLKATAKIPIPSLLTIGNCRHSKLQARLFFGMGVAVFALGAVDVQAEDGVLCYQPLPALQFDLPDSEEDEFGLRAPPAIDQAFRPGQSTVTSSGHIIGADEFYFDQSSGVIEAQGNVRVVSEDYQLDGESARLNSEQEDLTATNLNFKLFEIDSENSSIRYNRGRGSAELFAIQQGIVRLDSTDFTLCPEGNDDIAIRASDLTINPENRQGVARNATVRLRGRPILYVPYVRFPVGSDRLSGFLFPTVGASNSLGTHIEVPYYFNLAPNRDSTLTTAYYSKRGLQLQNEYRYLGAHSDWIFLGEYMDRDDRYVNKERRYGAEVKGKLHNGGSLYASMDAGWVSDDTYFGDYSGVFSRQDKDYLLQNVSLSYANHGLVLSAGINKFVHSQPLEEGQTEDERDDEREPYNRTPWVAIDYTTPMPFNSLFSTSLIWDRFKHSERPAARRFYGESKISSHFSTGFLETDLEAGIEYLRYSLTSPDDSQTSKMKVDSSFASIDSRLFFDRYSDAGRDHRWTLVPRIKLLATENTDQSNLPNYDTTANVLDSYDRIFQDSPYIGGDRLRESNQVSIGVSAQYGDLASPFPSGSLGIGRVYYPDGHRSSLDGAVTDPNDPNASLPPETRKSDVYLETRLNSHATTFEYKALVSTETDKISASSMRFTRALSDQAEFTSVFRHLRNDQSQWGNAIGFKASSNWLIRLQTVHSVDPDHLQDAKLSFEYQSCCANIAVVLEREREADGSHDDSINLMFDLTPQL